MQTTSYYPVIMTRDVHATTDFYSRGLLVFSAISDGTQS